jgi:hypothetical protein
MDYATAMAGAMNLDYELGYLPPEPCCAGEGCMYCLPDD